MLPVVSHTLLRLGNTLLDREPWARQRLQNHAGKVIALRLDQREHLFCIDRQGHLSQTIPDIEASVQVTLASRDLPQLLSSDRENRLRVVHIQGEAALAQTLAELAGQLRWDVEDDLARWIGDIPARRLVTVGKQGLQLLQTTLRNFSQNIAEYAVYEAEHLPRRTDFEQWRHEVHELDQRTQQLLQRASALPAPKPPTVP